MPKQTTVAERQALGLVGDQADGSPWRDLVSKTSNIRQINMVQIVTNVSSEDYTVTINGTAFTITSDASATKPEITAALKVAIDNGSEPVTVDDDLTDTLTITSTGDEATDSFTLTTTADTASAISDLSILTQGQDVPFGVVMVKSASGDRRARLPYLAADITTVANVHGIAVRDDTLEQVRDATVAVYKAGKDVGLVRHGRILVVVEDAVAQGGSAFVRYLPSGSKTDLGGFRSDADSSTAAALPNAVYRTSASAGALAVVEFNVT